MRRRLKTGWEDIPSDGHVANVNIPVMRRALEKRQAKSLKDSQDRHNKGLPAPGFAVRDRHTGEVLGKYDQKSAQGARDEVDWHRKRGRDVGVTTAGE